jgi:hypothetical protein
MAKDVHEFSTIFDSGLEVTHDIVHSDKSDSADM